MNSNENLLMFSPKNFIDFLKLEKIYRFYFVYNSGGKLVSSHKLLQPIADYIGNDKRDFEKHEGLFFQISKKYDILLGAFIHRTNRGQAAGGVRYWSYNIIEDYFRDGLRLAKGMTHKNALAGLWWGGGKGVMAHNPDFDKYDSKLRSFIYSEYGEFISSLNGCYVTAEDVGTNVTDMSAIFSKTRFTTCIPPNLGGSGNPSIPTARGVVAGMEAALEFSLNDTLKGKTVAVQGVGNVGEPLIRFLFNKGVQKVIACDINKENVKKVKEKFDKENIEVSVVEKNDFSIFGSDCDILSPCATGAVLNPVTISSIKARIICGAANNQLEDPDRDDKLLQKKGIIYVPDFLTNRMGIVNCANEQYGYVNDDPFVERHLHKDWDFSVYQTTQRVLNESKNSNETPGKVALKLADKLSYENHPIFGHRGRQIINSLVEDKWHTKITK